MDILILREEAALPCPVNKGNRKPSLFDQRLFKVMRLLSRIRLAIVVSYRVVPDTISQIPVVSSLRCQGRRTRCRMRPTARSKGMLREDAPTIAQSVG